MDSLSVSMMKGFAVWIEGTSVTGFRLNLGSLRPLGVAPVGTCPAPALGPLGSSEGWSHGNGGGKKSQTHNFQDSQGTRQRLYVRIRLTPPSAASAAKEILVDL